MPPRPRTPLLTLIRRAGLAGASLVVWTAAVLASDTIRVQPLARDGRILVSFEMPLGITEEITAAIRSGLVTTFVYDVELRRGTSLWLDRTIDQAQVAATVQYDNLRRRYQLSRSVNGRMEPKAGVTEDPDDVRKWLTAFDRLPLFSTKGLEANGEYYVRVRARTRPRAAWSLWPWGSGGTSGLAKFTFIP